MNSARKNSIILGILILLTAGSHVEQISAQGFIIPPPIRPPHHILPKLTEHRVEVKIIDQVAKVEVHQVFYNESNRPIEGTYYFPLPKGATVSDFKMVADGKVLSGELLEKSKARKIYEDIVRRQLDPALLEYVDHNLFSAKIFPIPPHKKRKIVLEYSSLLKLDGDIVQFTYPLRGQIASRGQWSPPTISSDERNRNRPDEENKRSSPIDQIVSIHLQSKIPLKNIYSPSHDVEMIKTDDNHARINYEGKRKKSSDTFILYYSFSRSDFGLNLLTYRPEENENGFFMLLISPKTEISKNEILKKDILFVLDTSGSMEGEKIGQAKEALKYCIQHLNSEDRFNLITFSTETKLFKQKLVSASEYQRDALRYIDRIDAKGGTNINDALIEALSMEYETSRPVSIVFVTDGLPTAGETDVGNIIKNVSENNKNKVKIFTFGVGYDVNTVLLDRIATSNRSVSDYIEPNENIEQKISTFYDKIRHPVLTDLLVDYGRIEIEDVYPKMLPDLFKGSQLTIFGRYENQKRVTLSLKGKIKGKEKRYKYRADFSSTDDDHDFLPHLWATRKIGYLLDEIRLHGENKELKDEVIRLSKKYGVMSPYTSYLVQEEVLIVDGRRILSPNARPTGGINQADRAYEAAAGLKTSAMQGANAPMVSGIHAVKMSKQSREMKEAEALTDDDYIKVIGSRTFYFKDDFWVDSEYNDEKTMAIKYSSQAYIDLLLSYPKIAKFLTLGEKVIFKYKRQFIKICDEGKETFSKYELKKLFG